ncbi:MAG TPA: tachylectin-related carbohydrate-binding protein [Actinocrinis sp.]|nr:tachylectin-related carbohydrate-binding protein [Actinocrinis sp.]
MSGSSKRRDRAVRRLSLFGAAIAVAGIATSVAMDTQASASASLSSTTAAVNKNRHILAPTVPMVVASATGPTETCTTPSVPMYHVDALGSLDRWSFAAPLTGKPGWTEHSIGSGWAGLDVISGGDGVLYTIDSSGALHWYSDGAYAGGGSDWAPNGGAVIGTGWGGLRTVISGGDGVFYSVDSAGNLRWYRDLSMNGTADWASNSGTVIGTGWGSARLVAAGGNGVIFAVQPSGTLSWYRHLSPLGGAATWANGGNGATIGSGWGGFTQLASMGGGVLLARGPTGTVSWYRDTDPLGGTHSWANGASGISEGTGWSNTQLVTDISGCDAV